MIVNNKGESRIVFLTENYAIKIPRFYKRDDFYGVIINFLNGWLANRYEYKWSKSNIYDFLCPVEYSFLFSIVIVMPRAEQISYIEFIKQSKLNFSYEHKQDSYGKINNKIVIVDYGN